MYSGDPGSIQAAAYRQSTCKGSDVSSFHRSVRFFLACIKCFVNERALQARNDDCRCPNHIPHLYRICYPPLLHFWLTDYRWPILVSAFLTALLCLTHTCLALITCLFSRCPLR